MLLDTRRTLKIADFGVARVEAQNPKDMTGETGTLGYMAPEVPIPCQNSETVFNEVIFYLWAKQDKSLTWKFHVQVLDGKPYNRKCDVYSFGICLWEIYCCDMPYPDLSFADVSSAVVRQVCL